VPVREPAFWQDVRSDLTYLLYVLTRDAVQFDFTAKDAAADVSTSSSAPFHADCISLLSGGIDSLAGAVMLLKTGRQPLFVSHSSGNPTIRKTQATVAGCLEKLVPDGVRIAEIGLHGGGNGSPQHPFPPADQREPSQRARSFLFMSLAMAAAVGQGVNEAFIFENGILTMALPLSEARVGGFSTRSTHPKVIALMNQLCQKAQLGCQLRNPLVYQTKGEIIRDILRPALSPFDIQRTVSCWATGRSSRQCGGCVACLVRRFSMLTAGLPDEAYEIDLLGRPGDYVGTDGYSNLMDLLGQALSFADSDDNKLLFSYPELLDLPAGGVSIPETISMYRRHAEQVLAVVDQHFPAVAALL
jgi:7-cyano-7-deazaguanine synthase in queuosine biosynthesis